MKLFLLFSMLFTSAVLQAQDSWKVSLNGKVLLNTTKEDPDKNIIRLKASGLKKKNFLIIHFKDSSLQPGWERYMAAVADNGHETTRQKTVILKIKNSMLLSWFSKSRLIKIYTWSLPSDPDMQAAVRVRRIHLSTLKLE